MSDSSLMASYSEPSELSETRPRRLLWRIYSEDAGERCRGSSKLFIFLETLCRGTIDFLFTFPRPIMSSKVRIEVLREAAEVGLDISESFPRSVEPCFSNMLVSSLNIMC